MLLSAALGACTSGERAAFRALEQSPAFTVSTITLDSLGQPIGSINGVARCGDMLLVADSMGQVRRFDLGMATTRPSIARDIANDVIAVACETRTLYVLGDSPSKSARSRRALHAVDIDTGADRLIGEPELLMVPSRTATIDGDTMVIGGTWMPIPDGSYRQPVAGRFYSDKKLGVRVDVRTGDVRPLFTPPFGIECRAMCGYSSLSPVSGRSDIRWIATQAASHDIALLDATGGLVKRIDITTPLFKDDGTRTDGSSEASLRWAARNSAVRAADQFGDLVATIHYRLRMPEGWVFGQSLEADYWMNLHDFDGKLRAADLRLPGTPAGRDEGHLYAIDYGAGGRQSAPDTVQIHRIQITR